jgi:hypothetical protein
MNSDTEMHHLRRPAKPFRIEQKTKETTTLTPLTTTKKQQFLYRCCICDSYYKKDQFTPSSIAHKISHCCRCQKKKSLLWRTSTEDRRIALRLYEMERRKYGRSGTFPLPMITRILEKFQRKSIISGIKENLSIRRFYSDIPFSEWNCIVITTNENKTISKVRKNGERYFDKKIPAHILREMKNNREKYLASSSFSPTM